MNKGWLQKVVPHAVAVAVFLIVALVYCRPTLEGKVLQQQDITQWKAMAQNSFQYKEKHGHFPLWTNGLFSGMPAYQIAMEGTTVVGPGIFYHVMTLGLPKPISFFFLACLCFYFLSQVLRINPYIGIVGALGYAYATYNPIIVAVGHDTKMQSIAVMPFLVGAVVWVYEKKYILGGALTALATVLLIIMNHPQIAYYTFIILAFMSVGYAVRWIKRRAFKHMIVSYAIVAVAGVLGVLTNAVSIFTTYEYAKTSIRGGSALAAEKSNSTKNGLSKDYALSYSMYKSEPLVMLVPKMFGGSSEMETDPEKSKAVETLQQMPQELAQQLQYNLGSYWGGIGGTSGPPYVGAIICFLALLGFFVLDNKHKWWILAASLFAVVLSWGSYFEGFNSVMLDVLPFYNKFRAPSMTLVIPTLLIGMMAVMSLQQILFADDRSVLWDRFKKGLYLSIGVAALVFAISLGFDYRSEADKNLLQQIASAQPQVQEYVRSFLNGLKEDRQSLFTGSLLRTLLFWALTAGLLWAYFRKIVSAKVMIPALTVLVLIDLFGVNSRYLNAEKYQDEAEYAANFTPSPADAQILQDTTYYRVFDVRQGIAAALGSGYTLPSYFHKSVGGYHPAKLSIYQDLIENQLSKFPASLPVYNMLNTKYIIQKNEQGQDVVIPNPEALGAAWFVKALRFEKTDRAVMDALNNFNPRDTAVLFEKDRTIVGAVNVAAADTVSNIRLLYNNNDEVAYEATNTAGGFAVFSEIFYDKGWKAFVDGKEQPIIRTNYVLRGLQLPAGKHNILFQFKPASYYTGDVVGFWAGMVILLFLAYAAFHTYKAGRRQKQTVAPANIR